MKGGCSVDTESLRTNDSVTVLPVASQSGRAAAGEAEEALCRYGDMVFRLAFARTKSRYDADDVLQEVFLRYIRSAPVFKSEEHRKAWLLRTTINCSKSLLTSAWFRRTAPLEDSLLVDLEEHSEVYYAVLNLSPLYRTVIHLFYYENYSVAEIAALLGRKPSTVKSQLHRARQQLERELKGAWSDVSGELSL